MKNKFRLKNKFKNKQLKSQMDRFRKMLLKDIEEIVISQLFRIIVVSIWFIDVCIMNNQIRYS